MQLPTVWCPAITGADIVGLRKAVGLSQARLADLLGYHVDTVANWEHDAPWMPDYAVKPFLDIIMARQREREDLLNLVVIARRVVLGKSELSVKYSGEVSGG